MTQPSRFVEILKRWREVIGYGRQYLESEIIKSQLSQNTYPYTVASYKSLIL